MRQAHAILSDQNSTQWYLSFYVMFGLKKREERKRVEWRGREKKGMKKSSEIRFCYLV